MYTCKDNLIPLLYSGKIKIKIKINFNLKKREDTCTPVFTAALYTISKTWKQPKCPSTEEWIKKWYIYTVDYYSAIKKNDIPEFFAAWMDLETFMLILEKEYKNTIPFEIAPQKIKYLGIHLTKEAKDLHAKTIKHSSRKLKMQRNGKMFYAPVLEKSIL